MTIADPAEVRRFAERLSRLADRLEELNEQTLHGLSSMDGWHDEAYDRFTFAFKTATEPITAFAGESRDYSQRLHGQAGLIERVAGHGVNGAGGGGATLGATMGGAGATGGPVPSAAGGGPGAAGGPAGGPGHHYPGTEAVPIGAAVPGFGDAFAFRAKSGGEAFINPRDAAFDNLRRVNKLGRCHDFVMHGVVDRVTGESVDKVSVDMATFPPSDKQMTAEEFADFLRSSESDWQEGQPIRLCSCKTGQHLYGFAARLSEILGVSVVAPVQSIKFDGNGNAIYDRTKYETAPATWRVFIPNGHVWESVDTKASTRAGWTRIL